ncbi:hypothetical protein D3C80_739870 [compost metagenome]
MRGDSGGVDQQCLRRPANTGAAHLGINDDAFRHVEIGRGIDIDMANAFQMGEDGHPCLRLHPRNQAFAAARHNHINRAVQSA